MATASVSADASRLSFAKVAASAGKDNVAISAFSKTTTASSSRDLRKENASVSHSKAANTDGIVQSSLLPKDSNVQMLATGVPLDFKNVETKAAIVSLPEESETSLVEAVKALDVNLPMPSLVVNGSGSADIRRKPYAADVSSDDMFQRTDSGSELGTKPPSLDGKSITSGTTFALDEKESLRPDDSASVKAAEEDDTFSGRGSIVAGSRIGSEAAARAYRAQQHYDPTEKRNMPSFQERSSQGFETPQSGSSEQQTTEDKPKPLIGGNGPDAFNLFYRQTPDEKLLEALDSPKDRIFLLRLEQDVIEFVKDSKEPFIDLPPCNSFCRMLTHKLADYYHMTHQVDAVAGAVRIFRTPFCRLPPPLTTISNPPTTGNTPPPPTMPTMKIMRRGGDGDTGPSPSKATSETGSDGKDKGLSAKEKLSREEREAAYNKARERIFGKGEKTGDATPETEEGNEMSRSSSVSTKDRGAQNKRSKPLKQRRDDLDGFDVRSQYTPIFPQQQVPVPTWAPTPQYAHMGMQQPFNNTVPNNYQGQMATHYIPAPQQFNIGMMSSGNLQTYPNIPQPQYNTQNQQRFPSHSAPITAYGSPVQTPPMAPQQWSPPQQQSLYPNAYQAQNTLPRGPPSTIPYPFGQLPSTANPADPKSQHPIPGSFNRHAFNPKTQSFVPGSTGGQVPQPMSHHGSPHHGSPHLAYNAFVPPQSYSSGMGYSMARQGSNNSVPSYHASPHMPHRAVMHQGMPHNLPQGPPQMAGFGIGQQQSMQGMSQNTQPGNHLPHYGNPSTLPPKPPTGV